MFYFQTWIRDKAKLIESTDELGNDLGGVITLQRRLSGLERDLAAIQAKVDQLKCLCSLLMMSIVRFEASILLLNYFTSDSLCD